MDPVSRLNRMMEVLRQQMAESAKRLDTSQPGSKTRTGAQAQAGRPTVQELRLRIQERVRAIEPDSADRGRKARRIFLESVLAWEFGDQLLLDSQLDRLIDSIEDTIQADPEMSRQFDNVVAQLSSR